MSSYNEISVDDQLQAAIDDYSFNNSVELSGSVSSDNIEGSIDNDTQELLSQLSSDELTSQLTPEYGELSGEVGYANNPDCPIEHMITTIVRPEPEASDDKVPTEHAVAKAIKDAIEDSPGHSGKVYTTDVEVPEDKSIKVELGVSGQLGGFKTGDTIDPSMTVHQILTKLLSKQIPPSYIKPTVSIVNNGGQSSGYVESGTEVTINIKSVFHQNDGGELLSNKIYENSTYVGDTQYSTKVLIDDLRHEYYSVAEYSEGPIKNDNLGDPYPLGHISAGSVKSSSYWIQGKRNSYYSVLSTKLPDNIDSSFIRSSDSSIFNQPSGSSFDILLPVGSMSVIIALPESLEISQIMYVETNDTGMLANFSKSSVQVADARGNDGYMNYDLYTWSMASNSQAIMTFRVKLK